MLVLVSLIGHYDDSIHGQFVMVDIMNDVRYSRIAHILAFFVFDARNDNVRLRVQKNLQDVGLGLSYLVIMSQFISSHYD
jgi:hypothetical protein